MGGDDAEGPEHPSEDPVIASLRAVAEVVAAMSDAGGRQLAAQQALDAVAASVRAMTGKGAGNE